jgi:hypothetical protein
VHVRSANFKVREQERFERHGAAESCGAFAPRHSGIEHAPTLRPLVNDGPQESVPVDGSAREELHRQFLESVRYSSL